MLLKRLFSHRNMPNLIGEHTSKAGCGEPTYVKVEDSGEYRLLCALCLRKPNWPKARASLNGQPVTTIQTNGTDGRWIKQKLVKVELEAGYYEMKLDFVKPGLQIDWIEFKRV